MLRIVGVVGLSLLYESVHCHWNLGTNERWGTYNYPADDDHCVVNERFACCECARAMEAINHL